MSLSAGFFVYIVVVILTLLISMTIHEFMHGFVAYKLGDSTAFEEGRLSLNPMRHIDPFMTVILPAAMLAMHLPPIMAAKPVPFDPDRVKYEEYGAALLAAAGPLSNLVLAAIAAFIYHFLAPGTLGAGIVNLFAELNVILCIFNLVPIPPLDGSRVLYAFAPEAVQEFMQSIEPYGFFIIIALVLVGHFSDVLGNIYTLVLHALGLPGI